MRKFYIKAINKTTKQTETYKKIPKNPEIELINDITKTLIYLPTEASEADKNAIINMYLREKAKKDYDEIRSKYYYDDISDSDEDYYEKLDH